MRVVLVNFTSTYHRLIARQMIREGVEVKRIYRIPGYVDPKGSYADPENSGRDHYREDPEFSKTQIIDLRDLQYADRVLRCFSNSHSSLSEDFLKKMSECEAVFMRQSDRFSFYPVSASLRRRIYFSLLCHCLDTIAECRPDRVIFADSPHVGFDTVLFFVCREKGIPTLVVERTHINNASMLITDYRYKPRIPEGFLSQHTVKQLQELVLSSGYAHALDTSKTSRSLEGIKRKHHDLETGEREGSNLGQKALAYATTRAKFLYQFLVLRPPSGNVYSRALVFNSMRDRSQIALAKARYNQRKRKLRKIYNVLSVQRVRLDRPYVFFPLHMQPEKTTSAFGGYFEDQYLALKILSESVPDDCRLYVKEHPAQLVSGRMENMLSRDKEYYELIGSIPKVVLVRLDSDYDELMQSSVFNATITGSVGWESLLIGKPAMIFGYSWYAECRACFRVTSVEDCRAAISAMKGMSQEEVQKALMRYLLYYERFFVGFACNPRHVREFDSTYDDQIHGYAKAVTAPMPIGDASTRTVPGD